MRKGDGTIRCSEIGDASRKWHMVGYLKLGEGGHLVASPRQTPRNTNEIVAETRVGGIWTENLVCCPNHPVQTRTSTASLINEGNFTIHKGKTMNHTSL